MSDVLRILDANFNRAAEGLRVVEDYLRMVLDDAHLTRRCKQARHRLSQMRAPLASQLAGARDTLRDVGTEVRTEQEQTRSDPHHVAAASQARVEQAIRCLEEYSKLVDTRLAADLESLRYELYTLAAAWQRTREAGLLLADRPLQVLIGGEESLEAMSRLATAVLDGGADILQLRDKLLDDRQLLERARALRELTRQRERLLIVNDRPDIALLCDADGVHLGQEDLPVREARRIVGPRLVGVSTHSLDQARQAVLDGADSIGCGPVFPSGTKHFDAHVGVELLREVAAEVRLPAYAIGGIDAARIEQVRSAGFTRAAVSAAVCRAASPQAAAAQMREALR